MKEFAARHKLTKQTSWLLFRLCSGERTVCSRSSRFEFFWSRSLFLWNPRPWKNQPSFAEIFWSERPGDAAFSPSLYLRECLEYWLMSRLRIITARHNGWVLTSIRKMGNWIKWHLGTIAVLQKSLFKIISSKLFTCLVLTETQGGRTIVICGAT